MQKINLNFCKKKFTALMQMKWDYFLIIYSIKLLNKCALVERIPVLLCVNLLKKFYV